jgi:hypothetical protein
MALREYKDITRLQEFCAPRPGCRERKGISPREFEFNSFVTFLASPQKLTDKIEVSSSASREESLSAAIAENRA